ncbi:ABC-F family ATP-binding cassette domain-containing protein [Quadrisphaera setariae]|uniref:ABC-F family ATP-binding cassette domain-containing protein n=1 Tax=Quadrisphaera setariae TaxID=2593304 RepID=A0A5C8ZBW0_9ACTN|nr:ABC-F family ATP-binding cassette domain-containing protein [Quadrisphaera setariae]
MHHVDRRYPDRVVLRDVSLAVAPGARVALVGENGSGKTTLLRVAAGVDHPDSGTVTRPDRTRLVHQVLPFDDDACVEDVLDDAVASARDVERQLTAAAEALAAASDAAAEAPHVEARRAAAHRYDVALAEATAAGVWSLDAQVERVLAGLGLGDVGRDRQLGALSGGQRTRLALAAALVARPTALLLDEPTNHLDAAGADFLAAELRSWTGPVLFASHDRRFIEDVATRVADLDPVAGPGSPEDAPAATPEDDDGSGVARDTATSVTSHRGAYSDHLRAKAAARRRWEEQHAAEQEQLEVLRHEVAVGARDVMHTTAPKGEARIAKKFYSDRAATVIARRVRSARSRLEDLERTQVAAPPPLLSFAGFVRRGGAELPGPPALPGTPDVLVQLDDVEVAGRLRPTSLTVRAGEHLLLDGPNGSGKSTLIAVLVGALAADRGLRRTAPGVRLGLLAQDVVWEDPRRSAQEVYLRAVGEHAPALTSTGLVSVRDAGRPVGSLSVGQQRRVALAVLAADPPDVLVLDEPTNHLSLGLAEELEAALADHPGAVVLASHDRWLRERWSGSRLDLTPGATGWPAVSGGARPSSARGAVAPGISARARDAATRGAGPARRRSAPAAPVPMR